MKKIPNVCFLLISALIFAGCSTVSSNRLPAEDIEVFEKHNDIISILRNPKISPNSKEKYEAAKELIKHVDLHFTRETKTVDQIFHYRDAAADGLHTETPVFTFTYRYANDFIRIRFFTCRMFVTRVEITENE
ncbi:MAG: hypothetical protein E7058_00785 [Lentisphaerae bacterium]|nr:hypothetical protein [Lentisphaerota bacterium]